VAIPGDRPIRRDLPDDRPVPDGRRALCAALAAIAALLCHVPAFAQTDAATRHFKSGGSAFAEQNYDAALTAFEAALAEGMSGPAIHFNIGVAAFRLGRYSRARAAFEQVARTPAMAALAHYNLGLVSLREGDSDEAVRWFSAAERESSDERLRELAAARLTELLPQAANRDWIGYAAFGAGYDDNVALVADADVLGFSGKEDSFAELQLALSAPLGRPWRLDAGLALVDYHELDSFDQLSVHGGGYYRLAAGDWMNQAGLQLAYTTLDGEGFENRRTLALQTSSEVRPDWLLRARYRFNDIEGLNEFGGLSGYRHEASARLAWNQEPWRLGIEYQFDASDYDDGVLSATRHQLGVDLQRTLYDGWAVLLEATRRHSRYDEGTGAEDRTQLALAMSKTLTAQWRLVIRYDHTDNDSDLAEFNYAGNRISAGVEATL
jgi:Flp pilus assembly protein TadD